MVLEETGGPVTAHAMSFDVEDWYQGFIYRNIDGWQGLGSREEKNVGRLLELLEKHQTKATFFVLGKFAEAHPNVVREIDKAGHEIASHGHFHIPLPKTSPERFREDLRQSRGVLADITGREVRGYRAASWSLTRETLWALEIMADEGLSYDSSMFPTSFHAYGLPGSPLKPSRICLSSGSSMIEFPAQVLTLGPIKIPAAGGFYLRGFPQWLYSWALKQSERRGGSGMVYLHPYDIDAEVPRLGVPFVFRVIRYYNLAGTFGRLESLLGSFRFSSIAQLLADSEFPVVDVASLGNRT